MSETKQIVKKDAYNPEEDHIQYTSVDWLQHTEHFR